MVPPDPPGGDFGGYLVDNRAATAGAQYRLEMHLYATGVLESLAYDGMVEGTVRSIDIRATAWYGANQPLFGGQPSEYHMTVAVTEIAGGQASAPVRGVVRWVRPSVYRVFAIRGMSRFEDAIDTVLEHEGGYVNDAADPGGAPIGACRSGS